MRVYQAFRFELDPNAGQSQVLARYAGAARFAFNWGLDIGRSCIEVREPVPDRTTLQRIWNRWKVGNVPWWAEVSECSPQQAFCDLERAFANCWRGRKAGKGVGFPHFRKKGRDDRFRVPAPFGSCPGPWSCPRCGPCGPRSVPPSSLDASCQPPSPVRPTFNGPLVGIDVGLDCFAVLSDGTRIRAPKPLARSLERLRRRSRAHSRKRKGSANRRKSALALARLYRRIRNQRRDFLHKLTTILARTKSVIVVEQLSVSRMVRNRRRARAISDAGWSEFRQMLTYKTVWYGSHLVVAPRFYPSSRTCSACGAKRREFVLSERVFRCHSCGLEMDRDQNAALNLAQLVAGSSPETVNACGADVGPA